MSNLENDVRKYLGLAPHNTMSNICYGDGHFLMSLYKRYGQLAVMNKIKELR
jgi:prepilin-type processing-associated H-X9-DG protein